MGFDFRLVGVLGSSLIAEMGADCDLTRIGWFGALFLLDGVGLDRLENFGDIRKAGFPRDINNGLSGVVTNSNIDEAASQQHTENALTRMN